MNDDLPVFESHRPVLRALAYRMLGDLSRAEDLLQDAWLRWQGRTAEVEDPRAFLVRTVTRLCLNELGSARVRHEESRSDRLPEPVDLASAGIPEVEQLDQVSMAFLVLLQRLGPTERAVLLLHEVFEMSHAEIAAMLDRSEVACRQLLKRARERVASERRVFHTSPDQHRALLLAFIRAARAGNADELLALLADDATLIIDAGPEGRRVGRIRSVGRPVEGAKRIAAFLAAVAGQLPGGADFREQVLNGTPAVVVVRDDHATGAILISVADGRIRHVFMQIDARRLSHLGPVH